MFARSKHVVALALLVAFVIVAQPGQTNAAFSGTNGLIAFQSMATDTFPTWSSNGSKIAFASFDCCPAGANYDIWSMNADGSGQTNLTNNPAEDILPAWQPGGSKIAFQTNRDGNPEIYTMNADGTG
jgi:Tol biopolymer transport system component